MTTRIRHLAVLLLATSLALPAAAAATQRVDDPRYGEVLYRFYQRDYFTAITHLLAARDGNRLRQDWAESALLLGGLKLSYGLTDAAEDIFRQLLSQDAPREVRNRAWYYLARIAFQKGRLDQASDALARMDAELPPEMRGKQQLLDALVRMQQGDYTGAAAALEPWQGLPEDAPYARYNRGIALVRSDQLDSGAELLGELGRLDDRDGELQALRDKANLALAQALLEDHPDRAREALNGVRLEGPMSNRALLGAGWAEAAEGDYRAALGPWKTLQQRPLADPAVQEALLAMPYALVQLEARDQAADLYREAIHRLSGEADRIDAAMAAVERGELLEVMLKIDPRGTAAPAVETLPGHRYLGELLSAHSFRRALQDYRDIQALQANLDYWRHRLGAYEGWLAAYRDRVEDRRPDFSRRLQALSARAEALKAEFADAPGDPAGLEAAFAQLEQERAALEAAPTQARERLQGLGERITGLRQRIRDLQPRLAAALTDQRALLDLRAVQELGARRDSLRSQVTQARFSLAQLYDPAADAKGRQQ